MSERKPKKTKSDLNKTSEDATTSNSNAQTVCDSSVDRFARVISVTKATDWDCKMVLLATEKGYWTEIWFTRVFTDHPLYESIKNGDRVYTEGIQFTQNFFKLIRLEYDVFESCVTCGKYYQGECDCINLFGTLFCHYGNAGYGLPCTSGRPPRTSPRDLPEK
eukprot:sb/3472677/